jgi:hypothetical protein
LKSSGELISAPTCRSSPFPSRPDRSGFSFKSWDD